MIAHKEGMARKDKLSQIFKMAIKAEQRAQKMYQQALAQCDDKDMKGILLGLLEDEERHEKEVSGLYQELKHFFAIKEALESKSHPKKSRIEEKKKRAT